MAAAMGSVDALVFTGGVGERSALVRARTCAGVGFLGVQLDPARNDAAAGDDRDLSARDAAASVLLVHSREELEIARAVRALQSAER
jgi:acetate kinase